jgi:hypothetical protein
MDPRVIDVINGKADLHHALDDPNLRNVEVVDVAEMLGQPDKYKFYAEGGTPP